MENVKRVAELLNKDELTVSERREGINLAQAIFGSQALATLDNVRTGLRQKKVSGTNDPAGVGATMPGLQVVIGGGKTTPTPSNPDEAEELGELNAGEFKLGEDVYGEKTDSADRPYYTKNGKRIKKADFDAAVIAAASVPGDDDEES